jgi:hypothetical protein
MNRAERFWIRFARDLDLGPPNRPPRQRPETVEPGERAQVSRRRLAGAYVLALTLPAVTAAALIPFRADHGRAMAIILVVPVVLVATLGATGPAVVAALSAGLAYDVFLTEPYNRFVIDDPDDITAAIILVLVGLVVGVLNSRLVRTSARDAARRVELDHLLTFAQTTTTHPDETRLVADACAHISAVLDLEDCRWRGGYHGRAGAVLLPDGNVIGDLGGLEPDRARLPRDLELPARAGDTELGRFILTPRRGSVASFEERRTAATIAQLFASALTGRG